jgi:hypothetical protein
MLKKKYVFFNSPYTVIILLAGIVASVAGISILKSFWQGYDFAASFLIACISVVTVNAVIATENKNTNK